MDFLQRKFEPSTRQPMRTIEWKPFYFDSDRSIGPILSIDKWHELIKRHGGDESLILNAKMATIPDTDPVTKTSSSVPAFGIFPTRFNKEPTLGEWLKQNGMI
jgi:hypothetical protein